MNLLILDFLRRWWWVMASLFVISIVTTAFGNPFSFGPAAMVCLLFDTSRGVFRAVRPLPVTRRVQAQTWWVLGVWLVPILSIVPVLLGTLIYLAIHTAPQMALPMPRAVGSAGPELFAFITPYSPWFAAVVQLWVGLGFAGLCFLLAAGLPTRPPQNVWETLSAIFFGAVWGLSIPGLIFVIPFMPRTPSALEGWHWAIFASVPFLVLLSYLVAPDLLRRRMIVTAAVVKPRPPQEPLVIRGGLHGVPLWLATFGVRSALIIVFIATLQYLFMRSIGGPTATPHGFSPARYFQPMQIANFAIIFGALSGEWSNLRSLRMLPLSRKQLAALLLAIPLGNGLVAAVLVTCFAGLGAAGVPAIVNVIAQTLYCAGFGGLAVVGVLRIASGLRLLVLMGGIIPAVGFAAGAHLPLVLAPIGALALLIAWLLLVRGLAKSSAFYQPRSFFGINIGQPIAVR